MNSKEAFSLLVKPNSDLCGLHCTYCFYKGSRGDKREGFAGMGIYEVQALIGAYRSVSSVENYVWQGGEPTDCGEQFFLHAASVQGKHSFNSLQTHGLRFSNWISSQWEKLLKGKGNWIVGLSHDGPTNTSRGVKTASIDRSARNLRDAGIQFALLCVVSEENVHKPEAVIEHFYREDFGGAPIQFIAAKKSGVTGLAFGEFLGRALAATPDKGARLHNFSAFSAAWRGRPTSCENLEQCGTYLMVDDGSIYPCDHFHSDRNLLAHVEVEDRADRDAWARALRLAWNGDVRRDWLKLKTTPHPSCEPCTVRAACNRGCPADYDETGLSTLCAAHMLCAHISHPGRRVGGK